MTFSIGRQTNNDQNKNNYQHLARNKTQSLDSSKPTMTAFKVALSEANKRIKQLTAEKKASQRREITRTLRITKLEEMLRQTKQEKKELERKLKKTETNFAKLQGTEAKLQDTVIEERKKKRRLQVRNSKERSNVKRVRLETEEIVNENREEIKKLRKENKEKSQEITRLDQIMDEMKEKKINFLENGRWNDEMRTVVLALCEKGVSARKIPEVNRKSVEKKN